MFDVDGVETLHISRFVGTVMKASALWTIKHLHESIQLDMCLRIRLTKETEQELLMKEEKGMEWKKYKCNNMSGYNEHPRQYMNSDIHI